MDTENFLFLVDGLADVTHNCTAIVQRGQMNRRDLFNAWHKACRAGIKVIVDGNTCNLHKLKHGLENTPSALHFHDFLSTPGSTVCVTRTEQRYPDVITTSWLYSQSFIVRYDFNMLSRLQCNYNPINAGGDCIVYEETESTVLKLGAKRQREPYPYCLYCCVPQEVEWSNIRVLKLHDLVWETDDFYMLRTEKCHPLNADIEPVLMVQFVLDCLEKANIIAIDLTRDNFMTGDDGRIVFVDHSDFRTYSPSRWEYLLQVCPSGLRKMIQDNVQSTPAKIEDAISRLKAILHAVT